MSGPENSGVLAELMAQAAREGADLATMRAVAEEAGELSATRALTRLGLADEDARADLAELRELLGAWRDAKRSVWKAAAGWVVRLAGALLLTGLAVKLGFGAWLK
ncbi:hypothetical protein M9979_09165 [Sphingomonas sp. RP10(2022)]|uniref:Uncharacterized protein n=1 Tax=Sphingomonas liriopis TaxID=2949094 RepID=A0A9X2HSE7_9SPHN|nr:DUF6127 family protein [Sphingomonas liriopis]MCP3735037.1 hypothetical protein [Sphingomonas liriopis]